MIRALALAVMLLSAVPAAAQGLDIDYAALFADKAGQVRDVTPEGGPDTLVLDLPGHVTVTAIANEEATEYFAVDASPEGAVGCLLRIVVQLHQVGPCDGVIAPDQAAAIGAVYDRLLAFHVANTWPPVAETDRPAAARAIRETLTRNGPPPGAICAGLDDARRADAARLAGSLTAPAAGPALERMLAVPRLPVPNPCL